MPFCLTRNMVAFLSMFGVDGVFVTAMVCIAQVCVYLQLMSAGSIYAVGSLLR